MSDPSLPLSRDQVIARIEDLAVELRDEAADLRRCAHIPCQTDNSWHALDFDRWVETLDACLTLLRQPQTTTKVMVRCDYCRAWQSKPCGEQCVWDPAGSERWEL